MPSSTTIFGANTGRSLHGAGALEAIRYCPFTVRRRILHDVQNLPVSFDSFRDVTAALAEPALSLSGAPCPRGELAPADARESLPRSEIARLEPAMRASARAMARALRANESVDLVASFAAPWSRALALAYAREPRDASVRDASAHDATAHDASGLQSGAPPIVAREDSERLLTLARKVFTDAARATSRAAATESSRALLDLARGIGSDRPPLVVQGFVALSNTLPLLLAGAWHTLAVQPEAWRSLRRSPGLRTPAIDELLRLASPARVVFRQALTDVTLGSRRVASGDELLLALRDANRCPQHFGDAERFIADRFATRSSRSGNVIAQHGVAAGTVSEGSSTEGSFTEGSFTEGSFTEGSFTEGSVAEGSVAEGSVVEGSVAESMVADPSVAQSSAAGGSVAGDSVALGARCRHVGLGLHPHACAGAALVRVALDIATSALLDEFDQVALAGPVTWLGGFAIDGITSLPVTLQRARDPEGGEGTCPA